ncbi:MAG: DHH family phosphoesterase [Bacilli bacterium]|nr:DHH family phosphoesterase [Bacilli bacterium]
MDIETLSRELVRKIMESDKVIIIPHNRIDFDAIGSAIGLSIVVKELGREPFIVVNDSLQLMSPALKSIIEESKKDFHIINKEKYKAIAGPNDLYILTDFNRKMLTCVPEYLDNPENIVIIDHHNIYDETIESNYQYINNERSSASEIVVCLLNDCYNALGAVSPNVANYLYAGISLDTGLYSGQLKNNISADTFDSLAVLQRIGANGNRVKTWFKENLNDYLKVQNLVGKAQLFNLPMAFMFDSNTDYTRDLIAKAADMGLNIGDASFACGMIEDDIVSISGRSTGTVNIGAIMKELGGGGKIDSGAAKFENTSVEEVHKRLAKVLRPFYIVSDDDNN